MPMPYGVFFNPSLEMGLDDSGMRCEGVSFIVASSILGHTGKVNDSNYIFDVPDNQYKIM